MKVNQIINGDCLEVLKTLEDNSVDLIASDPPYQLSSITNRYGKENSAPAKSNREGGNDGFQGVNKGFMGKEWDVLPTTDILKECLRVLKDGAFSFWLMTPRQDSQMEFIFRLKEAGFVISFSPIYWSYACLSEDTEILTRDGWEHSNNTNSFINKEILIYDYESKKYNWESPSAWHRYKIKEDMFRIKSKYTDQLVTKNHRVLTKDGFKTPKNIKECDEMVYLSKLPNNIWDFSIRDKKKRRCWKFLFNKLQTESKHKKISSKEWETHPSNVRRAEKEAERSNDGRKESGLEGRGNLFQKEGKLREVFNKICSLSRRIQINGKKGWLCYGTPLISCSTIEKTIIKNRSSPSFKSQSRKQQFKQSHIICFKQRPQTTRSRKTYKTTLATISKQFYEGLVFCPTVSTGCFVARRNGKIFLTGNSGFPKASNIGKLVDKRNNRTQETFIPFGKYLKEQRLKKELSMSEIDKIIGTNTAYSWWEGRKDGIQLPSKKYYLELKKILELDDRFDELIEREEAEREVIGKGKCGDPTKWYSQGKEGTKDIDITTPSTPQAKALDGSYAGFQPKPAVEVIIVAMKPLSEKTYVEQALKNGKGITWLDDCWISYVSEDDRSGWSKTGADGSKGYNDTDTFKIRPISAEEIQERCVSKGRFPANLLVSDDVLNDGTKHKSGDCPNGFKGDFSSSVYGKYANNLINKETIYADSGSFSRYFSLDSWWQSKIKSLPENVRKTFPFLIVPKASSREKNEGLSEYQEPSLRPSGVAYNEHSGVHSEKAKGNIHPTCKPIQLMSYLITLGSQENDLILDPFCGSGTTCISARLLTRKFIGIEKDPEYHKIAEARLKPYLNQKKLGEY